MIVLVGTKALNDSQQWVYLDVTVDGTAYPFKHTAPANLTGADLSTYCEGNAASYVADVEADLLKGPWDKGHPADMVPFGVSAEKVAALKALSESDKKMARIGEDIFEALKTKGVLSDSDLPAEAVAVINERKTQRGLLS